MSISTPQIMYVNKNLNLKNNDSLQKTWQTFWVQQSALHDWLEDFNTNNKDGTSGMG